MNKTNNKYFKIVKFILVLSVILVWIIGIIVFYNCQLFRLTFETQWTEGLILKIIIPIIQLTHTSTTIGLLYILENYSK